MYTLGEEKSLQLCIRASYLKQLITLGKIQISISSCLEPHLRYKHSTPHADYCCDLTIFVQSSTYIY